MRTEEIPFQVTVILGETNLSMAACLELQVGDILILDQKLDEPLPLKVGEKIPFHGFAGLVQMQKGIKIV